jgi:hypothetical protein
VILVVLIVALAGRLQRPAILSVARAAVPD